MDTQHVKCPNCGFNIIVGNVRIDPNLHHIFEVAKEVERNNGRVEADAVAVRACLSTSQARRRLNQLQGLGVLFRYGARSGWGVKESCA